MVALAKTQSGLLDMSLQRVTFTSMDAWAMAGRVDLSGWFRLMEMSRTGSLLHGEADFDTSCLRD
jgi:hypothetical protein